MQLDRLWAKTCAVFRDEVSGDVADQWLGQLTAVAMVEDDGIDMLYVTGPDRARSWIDLRYRRVLAECASKAAGRETDLRLAAPEEVPVLDGAGAEEPVNSTPLHPRYTFSQFVIGRSNHVAHAAALAVAEQPAQAFNPLFIYGAPGVGKTHLLHATGNYLREMAPELDVRYLTAEDFASTFRSVLKDDSIIDFKAGLRGSDVLLIDDVQFLQNKVKTEEEFFHTFNALHESGRQMVITCDRTPRELDQLAERLRERFEAGLVVEIEQPDDRLKSAILRKRVNVDNIPVDDDLALERIAQLVPDNVRSLEGALIRVSAFASMRGETVTPDLVDELLTALHPHAATGHTRPTRAKAPITRIQAAVADHFSLSVDELLGNGRERRVSGPRQIAMYLCCELSGDSLPVIAKAFGRDHSTVVHARDKVAGSRKSDPAAAAALDSLRTVIHGRSAPADEIARHGERSTLGSDSVDGA